MLSVRATGDVLLLHDPASLRRQLLTKDAKKRPTAKEALQHPWFIVSAWFLLRAWVLACSPAALNVLEAAPAPPACYSCEGYVLLDTEHLRHEGSTG